MKLSYTTLACPAWTIDRVIEFAVASRYDAIDFRGYLDVVEVIESPHFQGESLREIARRVKDAGLEVSCLSSSVSYSYFPLRCRNRIQSHTCLSPIPPPK